MTKRALERARADGARTVELTSSERDAEQEERCVKPARACEADDYRVPGGGLFQPGPDAVYVPTAALVLEVVSPDDETWEKVGFYSAHGVGELLIVDPQKR